MRCGDAIALCALFLVAGIHAEPRVVAQNAVATAKPATPDTSKSSYRWDEHWATLPAGYRWGTMSAVAVDRAGNVYGLQRDDPTSKVVVFDAHGRFVRAWGEGAFPYAHGLRALSDGSIWATDRKAQQVFRFDPTGRVLMTLGQRDVVGDMKATNAFNGASDVALGDGGAIFVSDGEGGNARVVKFASDGRFISTWGEKGDGPGQLNGPHCIAVDPRGRVWVGDRGNRRLQLFDQNGRVLSEMRQFGTPVSVAFANDRVFVASPAPENTVTIGTLDGTVLETIGGLDSPHGIAVDATGAIYVAESGGKAILKFVKR
ncbi:MAG: hypothetical protein QM736_29775 [Vicinamibacterales bacterium]